MGRLNFFALWSLRDAPRQFISKTNRRCYQVHIPLPLPKQLVVFGLGEWRGNETTISVEVLVSEAVKPQNIGILSRQTRCFTWEGEWNHDLITAAAEKKRRGVYGKILLTVCGEDNANFLSSTPVAQRRRLFQDQHNTDLSHTQPKGAGSEKTTPNSSHLGESGSSADLKTDKTETYDYTLLGPKPWIWPTDKTPRRTVIGKRGYLTWSCDDLDALSEDKDKASCPKKRRLSHTNSVEEKTAWGRMNSMEEKTAWGRLNSMEEKTAQGRMNSMEEMTAQGRMNSMEEKTVQGRMNSVEEKTVQGRMNSMEEKTAQGRMNSMEEMTAQGRMNGVEEKMAQGRMNSMEEMTAQGRMNGVEEKMAQGRMNSVEKMAQRRMTSVEKMAQRRMTSVEEKMTRGKMNSEVKVARRRVNSEGERTTWKAHRAVCPSKRWSHTMCLSDRDTAILIGGETSDQNHCTDSLWKLEIDDDFWFPMNSATSGPIPPCARGHSATYDVDSKAVYVYGGLREGQRYSDLYILNTLTWKWKLVTARGNIPTLAYHSATFYKKELFVFGGVQPSHCPGGKSCSNALYIFNPKYELWYQPIVEGDRPLPRFGHSTTLLSDKLMIFGGRQTATYLDDLHILNLGFMEYTAVKYENMPPLPRGFHAALPVAGNRMLVSGGCSAVGALQDVHIFNVDTSMWSSVASPLLSARPRAGHSVINLGESLLTDAEKLKGDKHVQCTLLVFGGSDCSGTFYNDTFKCKVEISADE